MAKTNDEMINALVKAMEDWSLDDLITWAQDARREMLHKVSPEAVQLEYEQECAHLENDNG